MPTSNNNNASTISSVTLNSQSTANNANNKAPPAANKPAKKAPSEKQLKMKENMAKAAAKLRAIPGWTPTAANITGLMGVMRAKGDENTFIRHAISKYEKRQIDKELAEEEKAKAGKTAKKPRVFKLAKSAATKINEAPAPAPAPAANNKTAKKKRTKKVKATNAAAPAPAPAVVPVNNKTAKKKRTKKVKATNAPVPAPAPAPAVAAANNKPAKKKRTKKAKATNAPALAVAPPPAPTAANNNNNSAGTAVIIDATAPTTAAKNLPKKANEEEINY